MSLMEMHPFGKGGSDIIWGLPFFGLIVFVLATSGFFAALSVRRRPTSAGKLATAGVLLKGLSLVISIFVFVFTVARLLILAGGVTNSLTRPLASLCPIPEFRSVG